MQFGLTLKKSLFFLSFLTLTNLAQASDFHSPRTDALGGAGHASPLLSDAIYLNPSFSSFMEVHSLSFNYLAYGGGVTPDGNDFRGRNFNISVLDGTADSLFQAGVAYTRRDDANIVHIGASKSLFKKLGIGIGSKFIFPTDGSGNRFSDGNLSLTGLITTWFQAAFIIDNLFQAAPQLGFNREYLLGTKFNFTPYFMVYLDPHYAPNVPSDQNPWGYQAGIEIPFFSDFFLRLGQFRSSTIPYQGRRGNGYGLGGGWVGPKISFDYSFSKALSPIASNSHNFGMTIFF